MRLFCLILFGDEIRTIRNLLSRLAFAFSKFATAKMKGNILMILYKKIIVLFAFFSFSTTVFAQSTTKTKEQAVAEAQAKEKAEAEARAKEREARRKLLDQQAKGEHSQAKMSETYAATVNAKAEAFYSSVMGQINEKHITWIKENAKKIYEKNLDELTIKLMANYYGKKAGLNKTDIDGLQVLLLRETYMLSKNEYDNYQNQAQEGKEKIMTLLMARQMLADSSHHVSREQLDSINLLLNTFNIAEKESSLNEAVQQRTQQTKPAEIASRKRPVATVSLSELSLTQLKLSENITGLNGMEDEQNLRMQQIAQRQQKITQMLSTMVNEVAASKDSIIKNLK